MKIFKEVFLILAAIIILFTIGFSWYAITYPGYIPTTITGNEIGFNINGIHMASPDDPTKIEITNSQPCLLEALSEASFELTINQSTYTSSPYSKNFANSQDYLETTIPSGDSQTIIFNNYYDTEVHVTSNEIFDVTIYPNTNKKIMVIIPSIIVTVGGFCLLIKITKKPKPKTAT